ncbi:MAG: PilZ domain-containing protein [Pseudomonadota bacterium]
MSEQRRSKRKILMVKAALTMEGAEPVAGRTVDVGGDGVCLMLADAQKPGALGMVHFELFHQGKVTVMNARSRVQYCILTNGEFKVGFQFVSIDLTAMAALSRFLQ